MNWEELDEFATDVEQKIDELWEDRAGQRLTTGERQQINDQIFLLFRNFGQGEGG